MDYLIFLIPALAVLNVYASVVILRDASHSTPQRLVQLVLVWLVPAVGAIICLVVASSQAAPAASLDKFNPLYNPVDGGGPDGPGLCSGGGGGGGDGGSD
jgi:hypothetical protein